MSATKSKNNAIQIHIVNRKGLRMITTSGSEIYRRDILTTMSVGRNNVATMTSGKDRMIYLVRMLLTENLNPIGKRCNFFKEPL